MNIISIKEISLVLILLFSTVSVKGQVNIQDSIFYDSTHSRIFELKREIKNEDTYSKNYMHLTKMFYILSKTPIKMKFSN